MLLLVACVAALRDADSANLTPVHPARLPRVGRAASLLFFSFAGWEAVTHLSGEFRDPQRDLRRVTALTLIAIGVLYVGLALTCVLVLGPRLPDTRVPLSDLLALSFGSAASAVTATLAAVLTFGALNSYLAGTSRLGAALARDGALPAWLAKGHATGETPRRSLAVIAGCATAVTIVAGLLGASLGDIILATSAMLLAVTVAGLVAGIRLLPGRAADLVGRRARRAGDGRGAAVLRLVPGAADRPGAGRHPLHPDRRVPAAGRPETEPRPGSGGRPRQHQPRRDRPKRLP